MVGLMYWNRFVGLDVYLTRLNIYLDASLALKLVFSLIGSREVRTEQEKATKAHRRRRHSTASGG